MITFALLPVFAALVAAPVGPDDACPSARQVTDAMLARLPTLVVPAEPASSGRADVLRALLDVAGDGTVVRFSLVDARGDTQLRRTLPAPGRGRPVAECLALADTLAAIVERYLGGIAYDAPDITAPDPLAAAAVAATAPHPAFPSPPSPTAVVPPRSALFLVGLGWRMPAGQGANEIEGRLGAEVELTRSTPRVAAILSVGASPAAEFSNENDQSRTVTLRRFPARLGASLKLPAGPGWVEPAALVGLDLLIRSATQGGPDEPASQSVRFSPGLEALVGYRLKIAGHFHLRARAAIGYAIKRYDIEVGGSSIFSSPRAHASFGIDTGFLFQ